MKKKLVIALAVILAIAAIAAIIGASQAVDLVGTIKHMHGG